MRVLQKNFFSISDMQTGLGRGLASLIPQARRKNNGTSSPAPRPGEAPQEVSPDRITVNPYQPRGPIDPEGLAELQSSIREHGILQPLVVTPTEQEGQYELIAGERRLTAARALGLKAVPVVVRDATKQQKLELALIENIQRTDLNPVERAQGYRRLIEEFSLTQEQIAERVGKARESVANTLRILHLEPEMQDALRAGKLTEGHAKVLLSVRDAAMRQKLFREMLKGMTVAEGARAARAGSGKAKQASSALKSPLLADEEDRVRTKLGTKVEINGDETRGEIRIRYFSSEERRNLIDELSS
jgi:ParB family chromosome partitioning protein